MLCGEGVFVSAHAAVICLGKGSGVWLKIYINTGISIPRLPTYSSNHIRKGHPRLSKTLKKDFSLFGYMCPNIVYAFQPHKKCGDGASLHPQQCLSLTMSHGTGHLLSGIVGY